MTNPVTDELTQFESELETDESESSQSLADIEYNERGEALRELFLDVDANAAADAAREGIPEEPTPD